MIDSYEERRNEYVPAPEASMNNFSGVAKIKVIGVGGAGNNAVDRLIESGLKSAEYIVVNTDNQALARSKAKRRIQIGVKLTKGLGAGADPAVGKAAAEENKEDIQAALKDTDLLFITAGMGGGTGTGAAPVIAKIARDMKILTVAVVTLPFTFEAKRRMDNAVSGADELAKYVDAIITIPNDKIREVVPKGMPFSDALRVADEVLRQGIRGIAELIVKPSLINLDFADVKATLKGRGLAHMGIGVAKGENRIADAVRCAVSSPLLNTTIEGASSVILNVIGGKELSLDEVTMAADLVHGVINYSANVIFGACQDESMSDEVEVVIIATGFNKSLGNAPVGGVGTERQAAQLSKRIDLAYNEQMQRAYGNAYNSQMNQAYGNPSDYYPAQPMNVPMNNSVQRPMQNGYAPMNNSVQRPMQNGYAPMGNPGQRPMQNGYAPMENPAQRPMQNGYAPMENPQVVEPVKPTPFEPNDPIPDSATLTGKTDTKHRPRFVDFFIKKNGEEK